MVDLGARVYAPLGDYRTILPDWVAHPGVFGYVADDPDAGPQGYILVGFYHPEDLADGAQAADLLAIAVEPRAQGGGVGSRLLACAIDLASAATETLGVRELRLTVAESNAGGQRLFRRHGFEIIDSSHGAYDAGQVAIRMSRRLP